MIKRKKNKKSTGQSTDMEHQVISDFNHNNIDKNIYKNIIRLYVSLKIIQNLEKSIIIFAAHRYQLKLKT